MKRVLAILGNTAAVLTIGAALITPFLLLGWFQRGVAAMHLRINPQFTGGKVARTIERNGFQIAVGVPVLKPTPLARVEPFVQLTFSPAKGLPARVTEDVDVDGDGRPDVLVSFDPAALRADVTPHDGRYRAAHIKGVVSFSELISPVNDSIVVRVPMN